LNPSIENKISNFPKNARDKFQQVRALIFQVAKENDLGPIEETLKWGQASYLCKTGSTIRIDWQPKNKNSMDIFFNCKTSLVETFKEIFPETFSYSGNRVIAIPLDQATPIELETCLLMALNYHKLKKLPLLGA